MAYPTVSRERFPYEWRGARLSASHSKGSGLLRWRMLGRRVSKKKRGGELGDEGELVYGRVESIKASPNERLPRVSKPSRVTRARQSLRRKGTDRLPPDRGL